MTFQNEDVISQEESTPGSQLIAITDAGQEDLGSSTAPKRPDDCREGSRGGGEGGGTA